MVERQLEFFAENGRGLAESAGPFSCILFLHPQERGSKGQLVTGREAGRNKW
jgi:hypothetical protein